LTCDLSVFKLHSWSQATYTAAAIRHIMY